MYTESLNLTKKLVSIKKAIEQKAMTNNLIIELENFLKETMEKTTLCNFMSIVDTFNRTFYKTYKVTPVDLQGKVNFTIFDGKE